MNFRLPTLQTENLTLISTNPRPSVTNPPNSSNNSFVSEVIWIFMAGINMKRAWKYTWALPRNVNIKTDLSKASKYFTHQVTLYYNTGNSHSNFSEEKVKWADKVLTFTGRLHSTRRVDTILKKKKKRSSKWKIPFPFTQFEAMLSLMGENTFPFQKRTSSSFYSHFYHYVLSQTRIRLFFIVWEGIRRTEVHSSRASFSIIKVQFILGAITLGVGWWGERFPHFWIFFSPQIKFEVRTRPRK